LCKQRPQDYTAGLISKLASKNVRARIETEYQDLLKEPIVVLVLSLLKLSIDKKRPDVWEFLLKETSRLKGINQDNTQNDSYYKMQEDILGIIEHCAKSFSKINSFECLSALVYKIIDYFDESRIKAFYTSYRQGKYFDDKVNRFIKLLWDALKTAKFDWRKTIEDFEGINSIPIMTIHKSKGLEYSNVYFVGLEDSAFWNFKNQPEEDRCAFFVALSRAKQSVTFTYCDYRNGMKHPQQKRNQINEFFTLLQSPGMANVIQK
jgi:superfamily I DNA/RNA helicase